MERVILTTTDSDKLRTTGEQAELCDGSGNTVGYFVPEWLHRQLWYAWAREAFSDVTPESIERIRKESAAMSTEDAIHLAEQTLADPSNAI